jgi:hypothetical protein
MEKRGNKCPKCSNKMELGFFTDFSDSAYTANSWRRGIYNNSFINQLLNDRSEDIEITAYRCTSCGFIELYAIECNKKNEELPPIS